MYLSIEKKLYLIPDSSSNKDIRIYKCKKFTFKCKLHKILVKDILSIDSLVFKSRKNWHMLTNMNPNKTNDLNSELFLFNSKIPISNNWAYQKENPILVNSKNARNGGIIMNKNKIFRVHQLHNFNDYGNSIGLDRISNKKNRIYLKK